MSACHHSRCGITDPLKHNEPIITDGHVLGSGCRRGSPPARAQALDNAMKNQLVHWLRVSMTDRDTASYGKEIIILSLCVSRFLFLGLSFFCSFLFNKHVHNPNQQNVISTRETKWQRRSLSTFLLFECSKITELCCAYKSKVKLFLLLYWILPLIFMQLEQLLTHIPSQNSAIVIWLIAHPGSMKSRTAN